MDAIEEVRAMSQTELAAAFAALRAGNIERRARAVAAAARLRAMA